MAKKIDNYDSVVALRKKLKEQNAPKKEKTEPKADKSKTENKKVADKKADEK